MGSKFVELFVDAFTTVGTGLASGSVGMFDGLMKTAEGTLTSVAEVGAVGLAIGLVTGIVAAAVKRAGRRVVR